MAGSEQTVNAINEKHLLLRADASHAALDPPGVEHLLKRAEVVEQRLRERTHLPVVHALLYLMFAHRLF